jgi:hypothetical protein
VSRELGGGFMMEYSVAHLNPLVARPVRELPRPCAVPLTDYSQCSLTREAFRAPSQRHPRGRVIRESRVAD